MKKLIFALIAGVAAVGAAQAQSTTAPRGYVGIGVATADHDYPSIVNGATNINGDGYKASAKIFGGYDFTQNYGVEAGYTDFRNSDVSYSQGDISRTGSVKGSGSYIAGKAMLPINEQLSAFGKLGVAYSERELNTTDGLKKTTHDTGAYAGLGLQYNVTQEVALTAEYERYGKSKSFGAKPDVWTVGAKYSF